MRNLYKDEYAVIMSYELDLPSLTDAYFSVMPCLSFCLTSVAFHGAQDGERGRQASRKSSMDSRREERIDESRRIADQAIVVPRIRSRMIAEVACLTRASLDVLSLLADEFLDSRDHLELGEVMLLESTWASFLLLRGRSLMLNHTDGVCAIC